MSCDSSEIVELLDFGAKTLEQHGITCLIEPLATRKDYYLRSYDLAMDIVTELKRPNLMIMLDTFHLQMLHGNLTERIKVNSIFSFYCGVCESDLVPSYLESKQCFSETNQKLPTNLLSKRMDRLTCISN